VLSKGEVGELCLAGTQVTSGYWNNPKKTKDQFIRLPSLGTELWYRTGDLVKEDKYGCLHYIGRIDSQVKIRGYRVELQEIDLVLRDASKAEQAVSLAWPVQDGSADGIVAFMCGNRESDEQRIVAYCQKFLPQYMVPRKVYFIDEMPLNVNGKIDRLQLAERLSGKAS
jgi:acyl-CoA synthetase (AMP-forming)/AMP-acid ligase II